MTVGTEIDAKVAVLEAKLAVIEAKGKTDWIAVKTWFKTNIPHFVTWAGLGAFAFKDALVKLI